MIYDKHNTVDVPQDSSSDVYCSALADWSPAYNKYISNPGHLNTYLFFYFIVKLTRL